VTPDATTPLRPKEVGSTNPAQAQLHTAHRCLPFTIRHKRSPPPHGTVGRHAATRSEESRHDPPAPSPARRPDRSHLAGHADLGRPPQTALPVGKWKVEFANGVTEVVGVGNGGESSVEEPRRRCVGMAAVKGNAVVITFGDDRVERWTPVGPRYVVEHWFPASQVPVTAPVLGIAERAP
jgi:hypothetical protein